MSTLVLSEEQLLLTRNEAKILLESLGRKVDSVERVCLDDAILYVRFGRPWTAWLERTEEGIEVSHEEGWSARRGSCSRVSEPQTAQRPTKPRSESGPGDFTDYADF